MEIKRRLLAAAIILSLPVCLAVNDSYVTGRMEFAGKSHDFGKINSIGKKEHKFEFKNTGDAKLTISAVTPSCGCTAAVVGKKELEPGEKGAVNVVFDPSGNSGVLESSVLVSTEEGQSETLSVRAEIIGAGGLPKNVRLPSPSIRVRPKTVNLGRLKAGEMKLYNVIVENGGDGDLFVFNLTSGDNGGKPLSRHPISKGKKVELKFFYRADEKGSVVDNVVISSNDPVHPQVRIRLKGIVE